MGMSIHIKGFVPPDEKWEIMKKIWDNCEEAGIKPPEEVWNFFEGEEPDPAGVEIEIPYREHNAEMETGIEIDINDIPKHVKTIRFYNSY